MTPSDGVRYLPPLARVTHQRREAVGAVHELAVGQTAVSGASCALPATK